MCTRRITIESYESPLTVCTEICLIVAPMILNPIQKAALFERIFHMAWLELPCRGTSIDT